MKSFIRWSKASGSTKRRIEKIVAGSYHGPRWFKPFSCAVDESKLKRITGEETQQVQI